MEVLRITSENLSPVPTWALLQRRLLARMSAAAVDFVATYTRDDGSLVWRSEWPGMDGSDDGYESFGNFPLFYALGGSEEVHRLARKQWEAVTLQFTEYGQIYREWDAYYDWMHHGESSLYIYFYGLADPSVIRDRTRTVRFAQMYTGEDPEAQNYDPELKMMRSPINGSRGPRFVNSWDDWVTHRPILDNYPPPFEDIPGAPGPKCHWSDDKIYAEVLDRLNARMMRGDVPLNLSSTSLVTSAFLYTGEEKFRDWVLEYTGAWVKRQQANGGIIPDNIGPSGKVGELMDGKWWGGYYGYRWPHGINTVVEPALIAASNCLLLTGDYDWLDFPRTQLDRLAELGEVRDGRLFVPHRHGNDGWYDYRAVDPRYHVQLWYYSQDPADWERLTKLGPIDQWGKVGAGRGKGDQSHAGPWLRWLQGKEQGYPEAILAHNEAEMLRRLNEMRHDTSDPETWDVHHWQNVNPVGTEALVQLTLGGPQVIYHGGLMHCRVRYFCPCRCRAGLPDDVAALVEGLEPDAITVRMVNLNPLKPRRVILQAGAFGEHIFEDATIGEEPRRPLHSNHLRVDLPPAGNAVIRLGMKRYVNTPSYHFPWHDI